MSGLSFFLFYRFKVMVNLDLSDDVAQDDGYASEGTGSLSPSLINVYNMEV